LLSVAPRLGLVKRGLPRKPGDDEPFPLTLQVRIFRIVKNLPFGRRHDRSHQCNGAEPQLARHACSSKISAADSLGETAARIKPSQAKSRPAVTPKNSSTRPKSASAYLKLPLLAPLRVPFRPQSGAVDRL